MLARLGFTGFVQEGTFIDCTVPQQKWTCAFKKKFVDTLAKFKFEFPFLDLSYFRVLVHEKNWNKKWEQSTGIVEVTPSIIIKPSWKKLPLKHRNKLVLHIDPKMSFGTGHHETTRLCLSLIERFLERQMEVLDFGTGTGILGIGCIKLGAKSVFAVDNDPWSIENAKENIKSNCVHKRMTIKLGSVSSIPRRRFDLIVANIDFRTISRFITTLAARTRKQGVIIFSGILTSDMPVLIKLFKNNSLIPMQLVNENEWTAVALRRV